MSTTKVRVLCVTDFYTPGFKGGGLIRTVENMCDAMSSDIDFWIFTRDRDLGSDEPYSRIQTDSWLQIGNTHVYYASPGYFNHSGLTAAVKTKAFDVVYLNSFFSYHASISICMKRRLFGTGNLRLLIAPRGEFSEGALAIKPMKKKMYFIAAKLLGVYTNVDWHASTELERNDILRVFPEVRERVHLAEDLIRICDDQSLRDIHNINHNTDLRLVFVSRISPKKNVDGLLDIISGVNKQISLTIYGPIEDEAYWLRCQTIISGLPDNVHVHYSGELRPEEVSKVFAGFDVFSFPTYGENFGHVIFESLRAGTPVFVSDKTPWRTQESGAITVLSISNHHAWIEAIESAANQTHDQREKVRMATIEYAKRYFESSGSLSANLEMFRKVASLKS